jgi:uncharacterized membrane protein YgdD (TMEM256/DUF423 family)
LSAPAFGAFVCRPAARIVLFCGSLYLLGATGDRWLGAVTPVGGLAFIVSWVSLTWGVLTSRPASTVRTTG